MPPDRRVRKAAVANAGHAAAAPNVDLAPYLEIFMLGSMCGFAAACVRGVVGVEAIREGASALGAQERSVRAAGRREERRRRGRQDSRPLTGVYGAGA